MEIWNTFGTFCIHFGTLFPVLESCTKKNLATLLRAATACSCYNFFAISFWVLEHEKM
jgi:hypothetical protein